MVRVRAVGVCGSDLHLYHGLVPDTRVGMTFGHEFTGIVEEVGGEVQGFSVGDHVSVWSEGKGYAEYFTTKAAYAYKLLPATLFEEALGEPIACSTNGVRKAAAELVCKACKLAYPVKDDIPVMLEDEARQLGTEEV